MAFIRHKNVRGYTYYQLVHNYTEGGKHRQEVLAHLGTHDSLEAAILAEDSKVTPERAYYERLVSYYLDEAEYVRRGAQHLYESDYHLAGPAVEMMLVKLSDRYHSLERSAAHYNQRIHDCQARLDRLLGLMDEYPQPIRSSRTFDLLRSKEAQEP